MARRMRRFFEIHQIMLEDEDYLDAVQNIIDTQKVNAEYAVAVTGDNFAQMFAAMEDEYSAARGGCQRYFGADVRVAVRRRRSGHPYGRAGDYSGR